MELDYNVETNNSYSVLANHDSTQPTGTLRAPKKVKPEHFIVPRENSSKLANVPSIVGKYNFQIQSNGDIKILPKSEEAANDIKAALNDQTIGWYAHPNDNHYKYVMYRVPPMDDAIVQAELNAAAGNLFSAISVKKMTIKKPAYPDQCNYLVYFAKNPTIPVLRNTSINIKGAIPTWAHYHKQQNHRSRCTNCQAPGHGSMGCHLPPKCVVCAGPHKSSQCPLLEQKRLQNKAMIDLEFLKCANCGEKHTALFTGCVRMKPAPTRQNY